jgi:hypothetical protein
MADGLGEGPRVRSGEEATLQTPRSPARNEVHTFVALLPCTPDTLVNYDALGPSQSHGSWAVHF